MISIYTKLVALLGNPLGQSLSTKMQNAGFSHCGLDYVYFPLETTGESLPAIVKAIRYLNFAGFGVTKPDKVAVMAHLDELDDFAARMGAVNTVMVQPGGRLKGYNTDADGFIRSLRESWSGSFPESVFLCLGAGGAARAICCALAYNGAKRIIVSSLYDHESRELVDKVNGSFAPVAEMVPWADQERLMAAAKGADVILNTTGVGMGEHVGETPVDSAIFHPGMLAFDAAYTPPDPRFLQEARAAGCETLNGMGMLLYQGTKQFELWTGQKAPEDVMRKALEEALGLSC